MHLTYKSTLIISLYMILTGALVGVVCAIFGRVLLAISTFRDAHVLALLWALPLVGALICGAYQAFGSNLAAGMARVVECAKGETTHVKLRLVPLIMLSTWAGHLFGASVGREGVAVQMGATIAARISPHVSETHLARLGISRKDLQRILLVSGMAAGFAALFRTPFAALAFALEVLVSGTLMFEALLPAACAAITGSIVSGALGLEKFSVAVHVAPLNLASPALLSLIVLGIAFGLCGTVFAYLLAKSKQIAAQKLKNPYVRIVVLGSVAAILLYVLHAGRYTGLGTNLIALATAGEPTYAYDFALKFVLTILVLSAGYQGGEVTPLFAIGATLGALLAPFVGIESVVGAALGYACVFGAATRTLLAPALICAEVFGFALMPYALVVALVARVCNWGCSIYPISAHEDFYITTD